jgi:hypothetical protein
MQSEKQIILEARRRIAKLRGLTPGMVVLSVYIRTGEEYHLSPPEESAAATLGRRGGLARVKTIPLKRRQEIGRMGAEARWRKQRLKSDEGRYSEDSTVAGDYLRGPDRHLSEPGHAERVSRTEDSEP